MIMRKEVEKSRGAKALYSRMEHVEQAKKDKKIPMILSTGMLFIFVVLASIADFLSIQPFQDRILRGDARVGYVITGALIFCIDVVAPITLPSLLQAHFKQKKLRIMALISIVSSVGILIFLNIVQKIIGVNVMIPNAGDEVIVDNGLKLVTLILYAIVPLATTIALTAISLQRDNYKIYQMMRYCILAETDVQAQYNELKDRIPRDEKKLKFEDDIRFITAIEHRKSDAEKMFIRARVILAEEKSPEESERILASEHLKHTTPYDKAIEMNPNRKVAFTENANEEETSTTNKED